MAIGNYLVKGNKTTCGGAIIEGDTTHILFGKPVAREWDKVTCGQHPGMYYIAGGISDDVVHGRKMAGTLDSQSTCPCKARFVPSMKKDTYEKASGGSGNEAEQHAQSAQKKAFVNESDPEATLAKEKSKYTSEVILITSTIIEKHSGYEIVGDHSAVYFKVENDPSGPYLFDPNGNYNPYKRLENGKGQRGSGFLFQGEFSNLNDFISYQENPTSETQDEIEDEWFPYKIKLLSVPVTHEESLKLKNAALALDDDIYEPGAFSCAEWSSKLLQSIEPGLDTYTLPNSLWAA
ncbi:PAAR domain-containing protein, partial [Cronobacter malonaticus]|nr:PAAR domain-containing protein [Cronobacter malonaticus]